MPVEVSSAGSRTSTRMGFWVGEGVSEGREAFICVLCISHDSLSKEGWGRHTSLNPHCLHDGSPFPLFHRTDSCEPRFKRTEGAMAAGVLEDVHRFLPPQVLVVLSDLLSNALLPLRRQA